MSDNAPPPIPGASLPSGTNTAPGQMPKFNDKLPCDTGYEKVRAYPKGIFPHKLTPELADFSIQTHIYQRWYWYLVATPPLVILGFYAGIAASAAVGIATADYGSDSGFNWIGGLIVFAIFLAPIRFLFTIYNPKIRVNVTDEYMIIGDKKYHRKYITNLRIGYDVQDQGDTRISKGSMSKLWLGYGQWGEDLPYMVPKYKAVLYLSWIKQAIEQVGQVQREETIEEGFRDQIF